MVKDVVVYRQPGCWLRSSHTFKECVIAHWSSDTAPKITGAKTLHRSLGIVSRDTIGRGAMQQSGSTIGRACGFVARENAGMSSERKVEIFSVESLRFPGEGSSTQGKSGPKSRLKSVDDGQRVDIPVPPQ